MGKSETELAEILATIGVKSVEQLINETVPAAIRLKNPLDIPVAKTEHQFLQDFKSMVSKNKIFKTYIGLGYYNTLTPTVILRNILENPGWYTAYTPYQAEIAQGRLEALINYQTMVIELTGMEIANASLLDEATAGAEAVTMLHSLRSNAKKNANRFFVSDKCFPQTIDVLKTRALPLGIELEIGNINEVDLTSDSLYGIMLQYPASDGKVENYSNLIASAKENEVFVACASDLLALTLLTPPGEMGADVVFGSSQRFGVPMGYGGPHAGFFATKDAYKRSMPGRIIGVSQDAKGKKAYRMSLQTREQHIKRERATSNICTAQVLLSVIAGMYAVYHGKDGLKTIAKRVHTYTKALGTVLNEMGFKPKNDTYFDTLSFDIIAVERFKKIAEEAQINFYYSGNHVQISLDETTELADVNGIIAVFAKALGVSERQVSETILNINADYDAELTRRSDFMTHPVFNSYHTEHEMLRYMKRLENKDLSMVHSMISLGSCTMKLNATTEMIPVTFPEVGQLHPFIPRNQAEGYTEMFKDLKKWLCQVTGFADVSLQPNSGAQGEYAGLMVIREYHISRGDIHRNIALIPSSAHGTNPASAVMAGMKVVVTKCDEKGNIDIEDLKLHADLHKENLSCLMVTYPSTHGVFEEGIQEICKIIHERGGQVYMDGANMNAQVGLTSPGNIGADVCHLNLHKTFCIPHGGGGPGMGPIGVAAHLSPFLAGHSVVDNDRKHGAVSAAPWGSASILPISYAYISMMGGDGLKKATEYAILNANYIKARLQNHYPILYTGSNGRCAHEMIVDCRAFKMNTGIEVEDIAKRLMDYGFHAPTVSFPVAGTLMIEPTESESKAELDRFCDAMIAIRKEIEEIEKGIFPKDNNVLKNAPHTAEVVIADVWEYPYARQKAAYPLPFVMAQKFWPTVSRIDSAFGDRNLICSCIPVEAYA
ncbi:MAG: glycine dehydrogenase (aminomethyl-transferring) [Bacteroidetes bacterium]|nr:MAG: glycine dehydrogenase (aminomethyl-transferring) [Bacteroidota bacterium]